MSALVTAMGENHIVLGSRVELDSGNGTGSHDEAVD